VITALRNGDISVMRRITWKTRTAFSTTYPGLFTTKERLFVVIDGSGNRQILREMYKFFYSMKMFAGIILSGTSLSMSVVNEAVKSVPAKMGINQHVMTDVGCLTPVGQTNYLKNYVTFSNSLSDQRLLERMRYWLFGR
jgi:hypothetical protein